MRIPSAILLAGALAAAIAAGCEVTPCDPGEMLVGNACVPLPPDAGQADAGPDAGSLAPRGGACVTCEQR